MFWLSCFSVPLPVYVLGPTRTENVAAFDEAEGGELCPNVTFLGNFMIKNLYQILN